MFSADQQVISDHMYANATLMSFLDSEMSRCVMWKEILSGVIESHNLNDDVVPVASLEHFRALKCSKPEHFRALKCSILEHFRALNFPEF